MVGCWWACLRRSWRSQSRWNLQVVGSSEVAMVLMVLVSDDNLRLLFYYFDVLLVLLGLR